MTAHGDEPDSGPKLPDGLGEPQWAAIVTQARAHFVTLHPSGPAMVMTACGLSLLNQMIYHPGDIPRCDKCLAQHPPPRRAVSSSIIAWFTRSHAPVDRVRRS